VYIHIFIYRYRYVYTYINTHIYIGRNDKKSQRITYNKYKHAKTTGRNEKSAVAKNKQTYLLDKY